MAWLFLIIAILLFVLGNPLFIWVLGAFVVSLVIEIALGHFTNS